MDKTYVASAVESEVQTAVSQLNQVVLDLLALGKLGGVHEVGGTELARPGLLVGVGVDGDDTRSLHESRCGNDTETDGTTAEDGDRGAG